MYCPLTCCKEGCNMQARYQRDVLPSYVVFLNKGSIPHTHTVAESKLYHVGKEGRQQDDPSVSRVHRRLSNGTHFGFA